MSIDARIIRKQTISEGIDYNKHRPVKVILEEELVTLSGFQPLDNWVAEELGANRHIELSIEDISQLVADLEKAKIKKDPSLFPPIDAVASDDYYWECVDALIEKLKPVVEEELARQKAGEYSDYYYEAWQ